MADSSTHASAAVWKIFWNKPGNAKDSRWPSSSTVKAIIAAAPHTRLIAAYRRAPAPETIRRPSAIGARVWVDIATVPAITCTRIDADGAARERPGSQGKRPTTMNAKPLEASKAAPAVARKPGSLPRYRARLNAQSSTPTRAVPTTFMSTADGASRAPNSLM